MFNKLLWTMAAVLAWSAGAKADFVAYNDFGGTSGANVTSFALSQSGLLKNYSTGTNTAVTINVVASNPAPANDSGSGSTPTAGDAYAIFNGIVNLTGGIWYNTVPTPYTSVRLDFTGLDPAKTYELVLTANRDNPAYTGSAARYSQFTISDMSTFTNSHSTGTTVLTINQANDSVKFEVGYNTLTGYVCRWTGITSGSDGDISVNVTAPAGTGGPGDGRWYLGGMRLTESTQKVLLVEHAPYLQLGNAPLANTGPGIGTTDQMVIAWQTIESGGGNPPNDWFEAEYRLVGGSYTPVTPVNTLNTGSGTRVNRWVTITGLSYYTNYEYRIHHKRNPSAPILITTYNGTFTTRRSSTDFGPFSFAAYGDSAKVTDNAGYESVINRISMVNPGFVTLLGDNVYDNGTHDELDAVFDASVAPNSSAWIRNHINYFCMGNHDANTSSGQPSLDNFFCPIPVLGSTSPVSPPSGETAEKNFSFDYGLVHFAMIDSTAWGGPGLASSRQTAIINWLSADLAASAQPWKIVCAHHPPKSYFGGNLDTGEGMAAELVPVLVQRNVSLLLVGHSHTYQRSFPITGYSGSNVTWIADSDGSYDKGGQVIQIISGTGGRPLDSGAPTSAVDWLAKALGTNNGGEVGPLTVDVSQSELRARWMAADDGAIKDQIFILDPAVSTRRVDLGSPDAPDGLRHVVCCDGNTTPWTIGGRTGRTNVSAANDYMYFEVSDGWAFNGNKPNQTITVDYFDKDTGTLTLQYDGTGSAYTVGPSVTLTNTNTWKTVTWQITNAYFGNRQNGSSDFRVFYSGADFYLDIITAAVTTSQGPYGGTPRNIPGTIQAEDYDTGGENVAYHDLSAGNAGGQYRSENVDIEGTTDTGGGYNVGWIDTGEWLEYTVNVTSTGTYNINMRVASPNTGGTYHIEMNGSNVTGTKTVPNTGGWQTWTTSTSSNISLSSGQQILRVYVDGGGWNFNYVDIQATGGSPSFANSSFEGGFSPAGGGFNGSVGTGWTPYIYGGVAGDFTFSDETGAGNFDTGAHSQKIQAAAGKEGGVYNQFDTVNGQTYTVTVRVKSGSPSAWCFFGINTSGGTDSHEASGTIYPANNSRSTSWQTFTWTGQATGSKITLFLDTYDGVGYWDTAMVGFTNHGFENGFSPAGGSYNGSVGTGWTAFLYGGVQSDLTFADETGSGNFDTGAHSQKIQAAAGKEGGVYNQINTVSGQYYTITVRVKSGSPAAWCFMGIHPSGGTNPLSGVIWVTDNGRSTSWQTFTWTGQATGNKITLFLDTYDGVAYWDTTTP